MKAYFIQALLCLFLHHASTAQTVSVQTKITDTDTMMVLIRGMQWCDTVFTTNGRVQYEKQLNHPELLTFVFVKNGQSIRAIQQGNERNMRSKDDGSFRELFAEGGSITFTGRFADIAQLPFSMTVHKAHDNYIEFRRRFQPLVQIARTIIDSSYTVTPKSPESRIYDMLYNKVMQVENEVSERFAIEHQNDIAGAYVLYRYGRSENGYRLDSLYQLFSPALQASVYLRNIKDKIKALTTLKVGKSIPSFGAINIDGKYVRSDDWRGKWVVLDFWGSWCQPCIQGLPKMKDYYNRYRNLVEFVGIACNDIDADWRAAVQKNQLPWLQLFSDKNKNNLAIRFNVEAYPTKIILDAEGRLVGVFSGETEDFYKKLDSLLQAVPSQKRP